MRHLNFLFIGDSHSNKLKDGFMIGSLMTVCDSVV